MNVNREMHKEHSPPEASISPRVRLLRYHRKETRGMWGKVQCSQACLQKTEDTRSIQVWMLSHVP